MKSGSCKDGKKGILERVRQNGQKNTLFISGSDSIPDKKNSTFI